MTLNLTETLKTSIYSPKHIQNIKIHFQFFKSVKIFQESYFSKFPSSKKSALYAVFYGILCILC